MILQFFKDKLHQTNLDKVIEVSKKLGINPNWLLAVIYFESAKTFSPSKTNSIGSVGLIQFTRDKKGVQYKTIFGKKYYLEDLKKMTFNEQMDVVYLYLLEVRQRFKVIPKSFLDVYFMVFFPNAIGKGSNYVLQTAGLSASIIAKQNPAFNKDKDAKITVKEVTSFFANYYGSFFEQLKKKVI